NRRFGPSPRNELLHNGFSHLRTRLAQPLPELEVEGMASGRRSARTRPPLSVTRSGIGVVERFFSEFRTQVKAVHRQVEHRRQRAWLQEYPLELIRPKLALTIDETTCNEHCRWHVVTLKHR